LPFAISCPQPGGRNFVLTKLRDLPPGMKRSGVCVFITNRLPRPGALCTSLTIKTIPLAANALRFYNYSTWAKIATGKKLNEVDKMKIRSVLKN
jgi:hypothetical protein